MSIRENDFGFRIDYGAGEFFSGQCRFSFIAALLVTMCLAPLLVVVLR